MDTEAVLLRTYTAARPYRVVRFYRQGRTRRRVIIPRCTLAEARAHCSDPSTQCAGVWFDGYEER